MKEIIKYKFTDDVKLIGLCDAHIGSKDFDEKAFLDVIDHIKKSSNTFWFTDGDLIDNITPSKISPYDQVMPPHEQMEVAIKYLEPIKNKGLFVIDGNHAQRSKKQAYFDLLVSFSNRLKIDYIGIGGYVGIQVGSQKYNIAVQHGCAGGSNPESELKRMAKVYNSADVCLLGHSHDLFLRPQPKLVSKGDKEVTTLSYIGRTGTYLNYAKYARDSLYEPKVQGSLEIRFNKSQHKISHKELIYLNSKAYWK